MSASFNDVYKLANMFYRVWEGGNTDTCTHYTKELSLECGSIVGASADKIKQKVLCPTPRKNFKREVKASINTEKAIQYFGCKDILVKIILRKGTRDTPRESTPRKINYCYLLENKRANKYKS